MESQDLIGWSPFIYGRVEVTWQRAQERWLIRVSTKWKKSSRVWAPSLASGLFALKRNMWDHRKLFLHSLEQKWIRIKREACDGQVKDYFTTYMEKYWNLEDKKLFRQCLRDFLALLDEAKQQWIESVCMSDERRKYAPKLERRRDADIFD